METTCKKCGNKAEYLVGIRLNGELYVYTFCKFCYNK